MTTLPEPAALEAAKVAFREEVQVEVFAFNLTVAISKAIRAYLAAARSVPEAGKAVDEIAKIIDPHSFMVIPFTDDPALLDMVEQSKQDAIRKAERILSALASVPAPSGAESVTNKVQHRVRRHKKDEWGPWTDGCVPADYLGWFEQREVPTEIGWRDKRIEILTDECERRSKQISEIAKQRNDAEIRAETSEAEATSLRRKLEEAIEALTRLSSPEAFCSSRMANDEERARMFYADEALASIRTLSGASE